MIGFYDYTVILTYISLGLSVFGITQVMDGRFRTAILCLALSGLCDMFDGKIARTKKNRTDDEKLYGIQIDSLCDVVCFGIFPTIICYILGVDGILGSLVLVYYSICSVIRLGFFNVLETNRQQVEDGKNEYYHGLPITSMSIALPLVFLLHFWISEVVFVVLLYITLFLVGTLFIVDFKLRKPSNKELVVIVTVVGLAVLTILFFASYPLAPIYFKEQPLIHYIEKQFRIYW